MISNKYIQIFVGILILTLNTILYSNCYAENSTQLDNKELELKDSYGRLALVQGGLTLAIFGYGYVSWGYDRVGSRFSFTDDGWFTKTNSDNAGMDKLGHAFSTKLFSDLSSHIFQNYFGLTHPASIWAGAIISWNSMLLLEVMDGLIVRWGFSYGDVIANTAGAAMSVALQFYPNIASKVDFRVEHTKLFNGRFKQITFAGDDYNDMKYLLVGKLSGFDIFKQTYFRFLELNIGYYSRDSNERTMNIFAGVGINLSEILNSVSYPKVGKIFNYVQVPYAYGNIYNKNI